MRKDVPLDVLPYLQHVVAGLAHVELLAHRRLQRLQRFFFALAVGDALDAIALAPLVDD